jgi:hypothetical protein
MFNAEIKQRFITEKNNDSILPKGYLERQFEKVSSMENELNKDVSNFTFYEIIEYYKLFNTTSIESLRVLNSQFSVYTQWCLQHNLVLDGQNHFLEMRSEDYDNCINKILFMSKVISEETILSWIDELQNPKDQFIILGLFEGIKGKDFCELINLRPEDVNNNIVKLCTGRIIEISDKLKNVIYDCIVEDRYYCNTGKAEKIMPLIDRGYVIKYYPNIKEETSEYQRGRQIYNATQRALQYIGVYPNVSINQIYESGKLNMIKVRAKELGINCIDYINSEKIKEVEEKYNCTIIKKACIMKYENYLD